MRRALYHISIKFSHSFWMIMLLIAGFWATPSVVFGQKKKVSMEDLEVMLEKGEYRDYFRSLPIYTKPIVNSKGLNALNSLESLYDLDPIILNKVDSADLRYAYALRGYDYAFRTGALDLAIPWYEKAHEYLSNKDQGDKSTWFAENSLATVYTRKGDYELAEYYLLMTARQLSFQKDFEKLPRLYINLARMYKSQARYEEAISIINNGIDIAKVENTQMGLRLNLADIYLELDDYSKAQKEVDYCMPIIEKSQAHRKAYIYELQAEIFRHQKLHEDANEYYLKSLRDSTFNSQAKFDRGRAKLLYLYASNQYEGRQYDESLKTVQKGLIYLAPSLENDIKVNPRTDQIYPENTFVDLLYLKTILFEKLSQANNDKEQLQLATQTIELAIDCNEPLRDFVIADASSLINIKQHKQLINKAIDITYQLHATENSDSQFSKARKYFNESKGLLYLDKMAEKHLIRNNSKAKQDSIGSIKEKLANLYNQKKGIENSDSLYTINQEIVQHQRHIKQISSNDFEQYSFDEERTNYIEYAMTNEWVYSLSKLNGKEKFIRHGSSKEIAKDIEQWRNDIFNTPKPKAIDMSSFQLYETLVNKFDDLPYSFTIIPDDIIALVNFELLSTSKEDARSFVIEEHNINYDFHYLKTIQKTKHSEKQSLFCLAPSYNKQQARIEEQKNLSNEIRGSLNHLPYAKIEAKNIESLWGINPTAINSKKDLITTIRSVDIFHYAGHALSDDKESFLALGNEFDNSQWHYDEIELMDFDLQMVTLSACETGLGEIAIGEGTQSLARSFMIAGANSVISSLWSVKDQSTSSIMQEFHRLLLKGYKKDEALREAKLSFIANSPRELGHPYYWGGFVVYGDMENIISSNQSAVILILGVIAIIGLIFTKTKLKK